MYCFPIPLKSSAIGFRTNSLIIAIQLLNVYIFGNDLYRCILLIERNTYMYSITKNYSHTTRYSPGTAKGHLAGVVLWTLIIRSKSIFIKWRHCRCLINGNTLIQNTVTNKNIKNILLFAHKYIYASTQFYVKWSIFLHNNSTRSGACQQ